MAERAAQTAVAVVWVATMEGHVGALVMDEGKATWMVGRRATPREADRARKREAERAN